MTCSARGAGPGAVRRAVAIRLVVAATTILAAMALQAAPSLADDYHVYACRVPRGEHAGTPEPVEDAEAGSTLSTEWTYSAQGSAQAGNACDKSVPSSQQALIVSLPAGLSHSRSDTSQWTFQAPTGETITKATLWRAGDADGGEGYLIWLASPTDPSAREALGNASTFGACSWLAGCKGIGNMRDPLSPENEVKVPAANLPSSHLYMNASCSRTSCPGGEGDENGYAAVAYLYAADIVLEDPTPPSVSEVSGAMESDATLSGEARLHFDASDAGSGVYQESVKVDGKVLRRSVIDEEGGRCKPLETLPEGEPAFLYAQPCPATVSAEASLNTTSLSNGSHSLIVEVSDAAGNETVVLKRTIDVSNGSSSEPSSSPSGSGSGSTTEEGTPTSGPPGGSAAHSSSGTAAARPNGSDPSAHARLSAHWLRRQGHGRSGTRRRAHGTAAHGRRATRTGRRHHRGHRTAHGGRHSRHRGGKTHLRTRFHTAETIAGRLRTPSGRPIADAVITATETPSYRGAKPQTLRAARTGAKGRFRLRLPARLPSARIRLAYASTIGGRPNAQRTLTLAVRASLTLHVSPRRTSAGHTIRLSGTLHSARRPARGRQVILEARSKGTPWLQFRVLRTGRGGRFSATHSFRLAGPVHYRFRAVCPRQAGFPFSKGASKAVRVFES